VIRLWEHQIEQSAEKCLNRVVQLIERLRSRLDEATPESWASDHVNDVSE
jgi:transcription initiation factor IIE alpha subunit